MVSVLPFALAAHADECVGVKVPAIRVVGVLPSTVQSVLSLFVYRFCSDDGYGKT